MGSWLIVLALLFSLLIAIIATANYQPVNFNYLFGQVQLPLIVLIIGAAAAGALVTGLIGLYNGIRTALQELERLQAPAEPEEWTEAAEPLEDAETPEAAEASERPVPGGSKEPAE